jgi:N-methylhydantoinase B/oxoprolinase/acetone carboxylase alpha subunit
MVNLGGKATVQLQAGDILRIHTPGAGGYGAPGGGGAVGGDGVVGQQQQQGKQARYDVVGSVDTYRRLQETA